MALGRDRLIKLITDFGGRVLDSVRLLPPTELKMCARLAFNRLNWGQIQTKE